MMATGVYDAALRRVEEHIRLLEDKPEEAAQTTLDARWFAAAGMPVSAEGTKGKDRPSLQAGQQVELHRLIDLRMTGVPLAHITGWQQFMGLEMLAGPEALIPRKETELLAEQAVNILQAGRWEGRQPHVIDLCTGAGNLAVVLALAHPEARVFASDISPDCLLLTRKNLQMHKVSDRVETVLGDLLEPFRREELHNSIDLITCNPPYISSSKVAGMESEISEHEPVLAFDGGPFGIAIINRLVQEAPQFLRPGGWLALEVGLGQGAAIVKRMEKRQAYKKVIPVVDKKNNIRVLLAQH